MTQTVETERKWRIGGRKNGRYTTFTLLAWDHCQAVRRATTQGVRVTECELFQSKAEREADRLAAIRAAKL